MKFKYLPLAALGMVMSFSVSANLVVNGSFEDPQLSGGSWQVFSDGDLSSNDIPGWNVIGGPGVEIQNNTVVAAYDGDQYVELDSYANSAILQVIEGFEIGTHYTLSFAYQPRTSGADSWTIFDDNGIDVHFGFSPSLMTEVFNIAGEYSDASTGWTIYSYSFIAEATTAGLIFQADGTSNSLGGFIDDVVVVPEPAALALFGLGLVGIGFSRRKRAK